MHGRKHALAKGMYVLIETGVLCVLCAMFYVACGCGVLWILGGAMLCVVRVCRYRRT